MERVFLPVLKISRRNEKLFKKPSIFVIINFLILANIFTFAIAHEEENSYSTIIGRVKNIDH